MDEATTSDSEEIDCPKCGKSIDCLWEYFSETNRSTLTIDCDHCGAKLDLTRQESVTYTAREVKP